MPRFRSKRGAAASEVMTEEVLADEVLADEMAEAPGGVTRGPPHGQSEGPPRLAQAHPQENSRRRRSVSM